MARKTDKISEKEMWKFQYALSGLAESLDSLIEITKHSESDEEFVFTSTNWKTAIRGLDYIDKFVTGLASQAVNGSRRPVLDELKELLTNEASAQSEAKPTKKSKKPAKKRSE